jgi:Arc/MetJ-type ribon-helix-helix transcriptional regulator
VSDEINKVGATSHKEKMGIQRHVTQKEYENESEAVKTRMREEYKKQKKEAKEAKMEVYTLPHQFLVESSGILRIPRNPRNEPGMNQNLRI